MSARHPRVSIGMPVYNGARFVAEALDSLVRQSFGDFELIVSDNASTDGTREICERYAKEDPRIRYHRQPRNIGGSPNFNFLYARARAEYFKWAPHDDVLRPDFLEACVEALDRDPAAVLCQSLLEYIDEDGRSLGVYDSNLRGTESDDPARRFAAAVLLPHGCYEVMGLFRTRALAGSLLIGSFHGNDRALVAEMALRGRFAQLDRPLLRVRDHAGRYTRALTRPRERAAWNDPALAHRVSLPTWRLYAEYLEMIRRNLDRRADRMRCYGHLLRWWLCNWNAARMAVDVLAVPFPELVSRAQSFKQRHFSPAPGAGEVRSRNRGPSGSWSSRGPDAR